MTISYFSYYKFEDLILEKLILIKNEVFNGSNNKTKPNFIILGNKYIDLNLYHFHLSNLK